MLFLIGIIMQSRGLLCIFYFTKMVNFNRRGIARVLYETSESTCKSSVPVYCNRAQ